MPHFSCLCLEFLIGGSTVVMSIGGPIHVEGKSTFVAERALQFLCQKCSL